MMRLAMVLIGLVALAAPNLAMAAVEMSGKPSCGQAKDGTAYCRVELTLSGTIDEAMPGEWSRKLQQVPGTISLNPSYRSAAFDRTNDFDYRIAVCTCNSTIALCTD
jgi:hypothetical protein